MKRFDKFRFIGEISSSYLSLRGAKRRGNLGLKVRFFIEILIKIEKLRLPRLRCSLAMTHQEVHITARKSEFTALKTLLLFAAKYRRCARCIAGGIWGCGNAPNDRRAN